MGARRSHRLSEWPAAAVECRIGAQAAREGVEPVLDGRHGHQRLPRAQRLGARRLRARRHALQHTVLHVLHHLRRLLHREATGTH